MSGNRRYLGDAVYADHDGYHIILTTEDGLRVGNIILLDPVVYQELVKYVTNLNKGERDEQ